MANQHQRRSRLAAPAFARFLCRGLALPIMAQKGLQIMRAVELQLDTLAGKAYELQSSGNLQDWSREEQICAT
jgi:hypothetical protein